MSDNAMFFGTSVPLPINDADWVDITQSPTGHIGAGVDERMGARSVLMKMYDWEAVESELARGAVSEEAAKRTLTPTHIVFSVSCGRPNLFLLSPDGKVRCEITVHMNENLVAEIWSYEDDSEEPVASFSFPPRAIARPIPI